MTRRRWRYNDDGSSYEVTDNDHASFDAPSIISEEKNYKPYRSMVTGEMIEGRKQHREHLKRHKLIEVGTEQQRNAERPKDNVKETIARAVYEKLRY